MAITAFSATKVNSSGAADSTTNYTAHILPANYTRPRYKFEIPAGLTVNVSAYIFDSSVSTSDLTSKAKLDAATSLGVVDLYTSPKAGSSGSTRTWICNLGIQDIAPLEKTGDAESVNVVILAVCGSSEYTSALTYDFPDGEFVKVDINKNACSVYSYDMLDSIDSKTEDTPFFLSFQKEYGYAPGLISRLFPGDITPSSSKTASYETRGNATVQQIGKRLYFFKSYLTTDLLKQYMGWRNITTNVQFACQYYKSDGSTNGRRYGSAHTYNYTGEIDYDALARSLCFGEGTKVERGYGGTSKWTSDDRIGKLIRVTIPVNHSKNFPNAYQVRCVVSQAAPTISGICDELVFDDDGKMPDADSTSETTLWMPLPPDKVISDNTFGGKACKVTLTLSVDGEVCDTWVGLISFLPPIMAPNYDGTGVAFGMYPSGSDQYYFDIGGKMKLRLYNEFVLESNAAKKLLNTIYPVGTILTYDPNFNSNYAGMLQTYLGGTWTDVGTQTISLDGGLTQKVHYIKRTY